MAPLLMILAAQLLIASGNLLVKLLETNAPVFQLVLYRQLFATLLVLPFVWHLQGNLKPVSSTQIISKKTELS